MTSIHVDSKSNLGEYFVKILKKVNKKKLDLLNFGQNFLWALKNSRGK